MMALPRPNHLTSQDNFLNLITTFEDSNFTCTDWESCQSKYADILHLIKQQYATNEEAKNMGKDYPDDVEELTKNIITTKLKAIRAKFRQANDSGKQSGHERVVLLYFELCEQIWGGSPATNMLETGI